MHKRSLFSPLPLQGQGTCEVESLRSYIDRLALAHSMKPRALLQTLVADAPMDTTDDTLNELVKRRALHGFTGVGSQLQSRLEAATQCSLAGSTFTRFKGIFASTNLVRDNDPVYCPCCVANGDELPYGKLLWEFQCVRVCPTHRVGLRSAKSCGAPAEQHLPLARRPSMSGVCMQCGSVGFNCIVEPTKPASDEDLWIAEQVQRLIELPDHVVARCNGKVMRAGLSELVDRSYGGSVVRASAEAGLSRSSVSTWVTGKFLPGLPWLLQLCFNAGADIRAVIGAPFPLLHKYGVGESSTLRVVPRTYTHASLSDDEISRLLAEAAMEAAPPSAALFAKRHGLHRDTARKKFRKEATELVAAHHAYEQGVNERRYAEAVRAYDAAGEALMQQGKKVHAKSIQVASGLVAFSQNGARVRAMKTALHAHQLRSADETHKLET